MVSIYCKNSTEPERNLNLIELKKRDINDILWIDLTSPNDTERNLVEELTHTKLLSKEQAEEIETTSKYSETLAGIIVNIDYYLDKGKTYESEPLSFILAKDNILVTYHQINVSAITEVSNRIKLRPEDNDTSFGVFMTILESIIDYEADMEELVTREITKLSKAINASDNIDKAILHRINELQEKCTALREDVYDMERVLNNMMRSRLFPENAEHRISLMLKDAESLINHGDVSFSRLDYLQDTALGLINIEQNEIVKILSVAAVIFMPPTLVASIYGMNFKLMPELDWVIPLDNGELIPAGYIFAIAMMVIVSLFTYLFFRYKKWL